MPTASIASRPSSATAVGVPIDMPSMERDTIWSAPAWTPACLEHGRQRDADPARVARVFAADLVRDAGQRDVALDRRVGEQVGERQGDLAVDHAVDAQAPLVGRDRRDLERGVDPVERVVRGDERGDSVDAEVRAGRDRGRGARAARGWPGHRRPRPPADRRAATRSRDRPRLTMRTPVAAPAARKPRRERRPVAPVPSGRLRRRVRPAASRSRTTRTAIADRRSDERRDDADERAARPQAARQARRRSRARRSRRPPDSWPAEPDEPDRDRDDGQDDADAAQQRDLVAAPEGPDRERLEPLGREVDECRADREQRRCRRRDHDRDEMPDGERRAGREESAERRRPGSWSGRPGVGCRRHARTGNMEEAHGRVCVPAAHPRMTESRVCNARARSVADRPDTPHDRALL